MCYFDPVGMAQVMAAGGLISDLEMAQGRAHEESIWLNGHGPHVAFRGTVADRTDDFIMHQVPLRGAQMIPSSADALSRSPQRFQGDPPLGSRYSRTPIPTRRDDTSISPADARFSNHAEQLKMMQLV